MVGALVYVMGPSGAGKDTVMRWAREALPDNGVIFAHRYITRAPRTDDENFVALSPLEFAARRRAGLFRFAWEAHGYAYGIGREIDLWREAGLTVVVSGSREHFATELADEPEIWPVQIVAPPTLVAERLAARRREDAAAIAARLGREPPSPRHPRLVSIENAGRIPEAGRLLLDLLTSLRKAPAHAR
jgi:ribose 1,5-bisphosphokinase